MLDTIIRCLTTCTSIGQLLSVILIGNERMTKEWQALRKRILITITLWTLGMIFTTFAMLALVVLVLQLFWADYPVITLIALSLSLTTVGAAFLYQSLD